VAERRNPPQRGPIGKVQPAKPNVAPVVDITCLDRPRKMKYDFLALMKLEEATGYSVLESSTWENMKLTDVVRFLWAGLLHEDPDVTVDQVAGMIHFGNIQEVMTAIQETFHLSLPTPTDNGGPQAEGGDPTTGLPQTGSPSGQQPAMTSASRNTTSGG
jgi:hypothetical protein